MNFTRRSPVRPNRTRMLAGTALVAASALALAGCSSGNASTGAADGALRVVATTTQLTDFAEQVGGSDIELAGLLAPGASAHHFDPSPADLLALGEADVLIVNGAGLETFVDDAVQASGFDGTIIDASSGIDLDEARAITAEESHEAGEEEHAEDAHADDHGAHDQGAEEHGTEEHGETDADHDHESEEGTDEEHDHDHGDLNPHIWTSPRLAAGMVSMIAGDLARIDSEHADDYTARGDAYVAKLETLDTWIADQFAWVPESDRVLVSGHDSLSYYLHDYDIEFAGSILPSFEDNAEPSAAEIDALVATIKERGVTAIFVESSMSPKLAQTIAEEAGVTVVDEESLYTDSLGAEESGADTYIAATIHNTQLILEAWGVTPDPVPTELQ